MQCFNISIKRLNTLNICQDNKTAIHGRLQVLSQLKQKNSHDKKQNYLFLMVYLDQPKVYHIRILMIYSDHE